MSFSSNSSSPPLIKREQPIVSTFSNLLTSFALLGTGVVTGILVNRALGPELKGIYTNLKMISSFYAPLLILGYPSGVLFYGIRKKIDLNSFFWTGCLVTGTFAVIIGVILFPVIRQGWLGAVAGEAAHFHVFLALVSVPFVLLNLYLDKVLQSFYLFRASNIRILTGSCVTLVYYVLISFFYKITLSHVLYGVILGQAVQLLLCIFFVIKYVKVSSSFDLGTSLTPFRFGLRNWFNQILGQSNDKLDQVILTFLLSASSFGLYTVGVGLSNLVTTLPSSYLNVFYTQIIGRKTEEAIVLYAQAQRITFVITFFIALFLSVLAYPLIYIMYGKSFLSSALVIIFYAPGLIFQVAARLSIKFYSGLGRPLKNSLVYVAGLLVSLPFYFILVPNFGICGAAIASSIAYFASFLFSFYQINREYGLALSELVRFQKQDFLFIKTQLMRISFMKGFFNL